jgi:hypothetical protein
MAGGRQGNRGKTDPVENQAKVDPSLDGDMESFDVRAANGDDSGLSTAEVGAIQERRTHAPHPFDNYQLARKVDVDGGKLKVSATHLVLLKPSEEPMHDRSNDHVIVGGDPKNPGGQKTARLKTYHTRLVTNRYGDENLSVVFDREVKVGDTVYPCSYVTSHAARAQLCYTWDARKGRVMVDKRYMLADTRQAIPLLQMFKSIMYQRTEAERKASEFDNAQESTAADI